MRISLGMTRRDLRALVVGVTLMSSIVGLGKGIPALRDWEASERASATEAAGQLAVARRVAATGERIRARGARVAAESAASDSSLLRGASPAEAAGTLALQLGDMAEDAGAVLGPMSVRADSVFVNGFASVAVRLGVTADIEALVGLLNSVEGGESLLAVKELTVTQGDPAAPSNRPEALRVEMVVQALVRPSPVAKPKGGGR
jgi:hypothetical protein